MKLNKLLNNLSLVLFLSCFCASVFAQSGQETHGGDAIVCFKIPLEQAFHDKVMTREGREKIASAVPLEYYIAANTQSAGKLVEQVATAKPGEVSAALLNQLKALPSFYQEVKSAYDLVTDPTRNSYFPNDVTFVADSALPFQKIYNPTDGSECTEVYAAVRRNLRLIKDKDVFAHFSPGLKDINDLHEALGIVAVSRGHHDTSRVQDLIISLLVKERDENEVQSLVEENGFGKQDITRSQIEALFEEVENNLKLRQAYATQAHKSDKDRAWDLIKLDEGTYPGLKSETTKKLGRLVAELRGCGDCAGQWVKTSEGDGFNLIPGQSQDQSRIIDSLLKLDDIKTKYNLKDETYLFDLELYFKINDTELHQAQKILKQNQADLEALKALYKKTQQ